MQIIGLSRRARSRGTSGGSSFSWPSDSRATGYEVGYSDTSNASAVGSDPTLLNDAELYPAAQIVDVGTALSWTNNTGSTKYARLRFYDSLGERSPWSGSDTSWGNDGEAGPLAG